MSELHELENLMKRSWPYVPGEHVLQGDEAKLELKSQQSMQKSLEKMVANADKNEIMADEGGGTKNSGSWLGSIVHDLASRV
jgi:hypothetical protein